MKWQHGLWLSILATAVYADNVVSAPTTPPPTTVSNVAPANGMLTTAHPSYTLQLNSNPTTGYRWMMVSYPRDLVTIVQHTYVAPQTKAMGAPGYETWTFQATPAAFTLPRVIAIKMMYAQPWNVDSHTLVQTFYLVTSPN